MPEPVTLIAQDLMDFANLPREVPEAVLARHAALGMRRLGRETGLEAAPEGLEDLWQEAAICAALASVYPWLNTFALDGAAKVGRLESAVDARFLDAEDTDARVENLERRFADLVAHIIAAVPGDEEEEESEGATLGSFSLQAV